MNFLRVGRFLSLAAALFFILDSDAADARAFSSGRTLGNSITVIGRTPALDRQIVAGLDFIHRDRAAPASAMAQQPASGDVIRNLELRGFSKITGLSRRGENYVFQAHDPLGMKVRVVMNAQTGEIVGLSRITPPK